MDTVESTNLNWYSSTNSYNCRFIFNAIQGLNGKINVRIDNTHGVKFINLYAMPNSFNETKTETIKKNPNQGTPLIQTNSETVKLSDKPIVVPSGQSQGVSSVPKK